MGWTFYNVMTDYTGKVDRKAECDRLMTWNTDTSSGEILKSSMRGSVYYAALKHTDKKTNKIENVGIVILTSSDLKSGFNFGYKDMEESMGPGYYDCPMSILKLLSPTDNEFALEWRKKCMDKSKHKSWLKDVKIGESIIYTDYSGNEYTLIKHEPAYQFKTWFWNCPANGHYIKKTRINENNARLNIPA